MRTLRSGSRLESIQACVFDAYGTLFDVNAAAAGCQRDLGERWKPLADTWRTKQLQYAFLRTLADDYRDFWGITQDALDYAMDEVGVAGAGLRTRLLDLYLELEPYPEVKPVLERLGAAGMKRAILSNGSPQMLRTAVDHAGIGHLLDAVLSAHEVRQLKPHPAVYDLGMEGLGLAAQEMAFMSANAWDAYGAARRGYRAVWINRGKANWERLEPRPAVELSSLEGLIAVLGLA